MKDINFVDSQLPQSIHNKWMNNEYEKNLVSVVIPTYNRVHLLKDALASVWEQTYRPIELLVVDDASTDSTQLFIKQWIEDRKSDPEIKLYYFCQNHFGAQAARNLGLIHSKGEYIQFLDSDDVLLPDKIKWGVTILSNSKADYVYHKTQVADRNLNPIQGKIYGKECSSWSEDLTNYLWHISGTLYRRKLIYESGPWLESLTGTQDWEYAARIKALRYQGLFDSRIGSLFRNHQTGRISVSHFDYQYVKSAEIAYDNIVNLVNRLGIMDKSLGTRFVRLYLTRALEYHCAKHYIERDRCLQKALALPSSQNLVSFVTQLCQMFPNQFLLEVISKLLIIRRKMR